MKVAVYQALVSRRRILSEDVDGPLPELRPRGPARHFKIIWNPELVRSRPMIIIYRRTVDDHGDSRQVVRFA
jgi:hypothetical protein